MTRNSTKTHNDARVTRRPGDATAATARRLKVTIWSIAIIALLAIVLGAPPAAVPPVAILLLTVLAAVGALRGVVAFVDRQMRQAGAVAADTGAQHANRQRARRAA